MITKKQYCKSIIEQFRHNEDLDVVTECDIFKSSSLAVAMEYLGLLSSKKYIDYAKFRAGTVIHIYDEDIKSYYNLSTRELLALLPD